jgi:hypothetical protein
VEHTPKLFENPIFIACSLSFVSSEKLVCCKLARESVGKNRVHLRPNFLSELFINLGTSDDRFCSCFAIFSEASHNIKKDNFFSLIVEGDVRDVDSVLGTSLKIFCYLNGKKVTFLTKKVTFLAKKVTFLTFLSKKVTFFGETKNPV